MSANSAGVQGPAVVTGAASGIGKALAAALVLRGITVVLADKDHDRAAEVAAALGPLAGAALLDVTDAEAFAAVVDRIAEEHGRIGLLVNNAGTAVGGEVQDLTLDHWNRIIDVNVKGCVHGVHAAYPRMVAQRSGHIVNIASIAGLAPVPLLTPYGASKWAVVGLSLSLRAEAAGYGVGVTVACPGVIDTPLLERTAPDGLSTPGTAPPTRAWVSRGLGRPYPPDAFARDLLRAVDRNRAIVISPRRARQTALALRLVPGLGRREAERRVREERERRSAAGDPKG